MLHAHIARFDVMTTVVLFGKTFRELNQALMCMAAWSTDGPRPPRNLRLTPHRDPAHARWRRKREGDVVISRDPFIHPRSRARSRGNRNKQDHLRRRRLLKKKIASMKETNGRRRFFFIETIGDDFIYSF